MGEASGGGASDRGASAGAADRTRAGRGADRRRGSSDERAVRVRVPSKINLFLAVRGRRDDGNHEIVSVLQTVSLHDRIVARLRGAGRAHHPATRRFMEVRLVHDGGLAVPDGEDNLVVRAARALLRAVGAEHGDGVAPDSRPLTALELHKEIPVAAGMAGGSADAAAALLACNELWGCGLDVDELVRVAVGLGADVPFCVTGGTALATGTGTATARVLCQGRFHWVVGMSDEPLETARVYRRWDEMAEPSEVQPDAVLQALRTGDPVTLGAGLHNGLQAAAFALRPRLREARMALLEAGALGAVVSGSGPTLLGLAPDAATAGQIAGRVRDRFDRVELATSPAGGPQIEPA